MQEVQEGMQEVQEEPASTASSAARGCSGPGRLMWGGGVHSRYTWTVDI